MPKKSIFTVNNTGTVKKQNISHDKSNNI